MAYELENGTGRIKCGVNGMITAKCFEDEDGVKKIVVRQSLPKREVLKKVKMDLGDKLSNFRMDPNTYDPPVFHPVEE